MRARRTLGASGALLVAAAIGGCSADGDAQALPTEPAQEAAVPAQPDEPVDDAAICTAYGDVLTIVENADLALADGRMEAQEHDGWYGLATRVLDRLPSAGDSAVRTAVAALQQIAPAVPAGGGDAPAGVRSPEWYDAEEGLGTACDEVGAPLTINVFTGG